MRSRKVVKVVFKLLIIVIQFLLTSYNFHAILNRK